MRKIRKGDDVVVRTGKDKGKRGTVLRMVDEEHVIVENVNVAKKQQKPNPQRGVAGGIVDKEMPVHVSNVALYNPVKGGPDRVGFKFLEDGRKVRVFRSSGEVVDAGGKYRSIPFVRGGGVQRGRTAAPRRASERNVASLIESFW
jgi:large subunit ribosomal protein L24